MKNEWKKKAKKGGKCKWWKKKQQWMEKKFDQRFDAKLREVIP